VKYTDKQIDDLYNDIYNGIVTQENLPEDLYLAIGDRLKKGLYEGYGGSIKDFKLGTTDHELLTELRENIYMFSGAKTYQQVREMSDLVADSKTFSEFKEKVTPVYKQYNEDWLKAEYDTAIGQAQQARQWNDIQRDKDLYPYLRYNAVLDSKTSDICRPLDGVTLKVDDKFWDNYTPLNHFRCRCTLDKLDKYEDVETTPPSKVKDLEKELGDTVDDVFKMNAGKDKYVFSPDHPYFKVEPKDKALARRNFDLPLPEEKGSPKDLPIEERIKKVKEESKKLHETGEGKEYRLVQDKYRKATDESNRAIDEANILARRRGFNDPETIAARDRAKEILEKRKAILEERKKAKIVYEDKVTEILQSKNSPSKFKLGASAAQYKSIERLKAGDSAFRSIVGDKLLGENITINVNTLKANGRAYFRSSENVIAITKTEEIGTITHELGHGLEFHNKEYFEKVKAYYAERTKGEKLESLRNVTGNRGYRTDERTKKDKFREAYTGKWYSDITGEQRATELTSMWFTEVYDDLDRFIDKDPDFFEHFYKLFNE
jgi:SPP1 gp7 family putative phage head morphogenesis protein